MAFINKNGESVSFECSELIGELKRDIAEFGGDTIVCVWCQKYKGVELNDIWNGEGDCPISPEGDGCSSYWLTGDEYIYYEIQLADVYSGDIRDLTEDEQLRLHVKIKNISIS